jgi:hypothetical protein
MTEHVDLSQHVMGTLYTGSSAVGVGVGVGVTEKQAAII